MLGSGCRSVGAARPRTWLRSIAAAALFASAQTGLSCATESQPIAVEINKLEPQNKSCRAYFLVDNPGPVAFQSLKLDLVLFKTDGVIDRRLALDIAPIRPNKKSVKIFDLDGLPCDGIGSILLNEVTDCRDAAGSVADCADKLKLFSRSGVTFSK